MPEPITIPAEQSNFQYQPPPETDPQELTDFSNLLKDSISDISNEFSVKPEGTPPADEVPAEAPAEAPPVDEAPEVAKGMERLIQREVALQAKEQTFQAQAEKYAALEREVTQLRQAVPSQKLVEQFDTSPTDAIKAMGKDPATIVRLMIAEQLHAAGKEVPPELQKFVEKASTDRRFAAIEAENLGFRQAAARQQLITAVDAGGREYAKTLGTSKTTPTLTDIFKANPDAAHAEIMEEIRVDARARAATEPNGEFISYAEAAKRAEARLAKYKSLLGSGPSTQSATKQEAGAKPTTPPVPKAPVKPLQPWKQPDASLDAAINDAVGEYHRSESAQKAARR